jgi:hypothetical protein
MAPPIESYLRAETRASGDQVYQGGRLATRTWPSRVTVRACVFRELISPATYVVRDAGSGGRYDGRNSRTRALRVRIEYDQPIRSAITVAGILG